MKEEEVTLLQEIQRVEFSLQEEEEQHKHLKQQTDVSRPQTLTSAASSTSHVPVNLYLSVSGVHCCAGAERGL